MNPFGIPVDVVSMSDPKSHEDPFDISDKIVAIPMVALQWTEASLRDEFAKAALTGLYANSLPAFVKALGRESMAKGETRQSQSYAREAYEAADAMLAARKSKE